MGTGGDYIENKSQRPNFCPLVIVEEIEDGNS
jgi:hypothetical protein